jgi:sugar lactone lactonase YvrE
MNTNRIRELACRLAFALLLMSLASPAGSAWAEAGRPDSPDRLPDFSPGLSGLTAADDGSGSAVAHPAHPVIVHTLARGALLHGANGVYVGPDGNLYVASFLGGGIEVIDPDSGHVLQHITLQFGMEGPDDLTFGPDGSLYWTSLSTGRVGKLAPDGTQSLVAQLPPGANPITFSDDGRLFVGLDFLGDALYEVYLDGVTPPRLILENLGFLNAFDFGPDGYLYGPIYTLGKVVKIDVDSGEMWEVASGFALPVAVKFDAYGGLYLNVQGTGEVIRLDLQSGGQRVIARLTPGLDNLAFDSRGRLFVTHAEDGSIVQVLPNGKGRPVSLGGMIAPGGVAVLPDPGGHERVFVADFWTLSEFNGRTGQSLSVDRQALGAPMAVSADGENLLVTSWIDNAVQVYDPLTMAVLASRYDFAAPTNAIRFQGELIVAELGTGMVVRSSGPGDRQVLAELAIPLGLAASGGDLWVADWAIGGVFQLMADGNPVFFPVAMGLNFPEGLAVGPDGDLLVVEAGAGRVSRIDLATGQVSPLAEGLELSLPALSGLPPFLVFNGIAVGPSGAIYVTGDQANVLSRIDQ